MFTLSWRNVHTMWYENIYILNLGKHHFVMILFFSCFILKSTYGQLLQNRFFKYNRQITSFKHRQPKKVLEEHCFMAMAKRSFKQNTLFSFSWLPNVFSWLHLVPSHIAPNRLCLWLSGCSVVSKYLDICAIVLWTHPLLQRKHAFVIRTLNTVQLAKWWQIPSAADISKL
jgi:hypothetical protein